MTRPPLIILGMHRSGTSCLTGLLEEAGLWLGAVKRQSRYNARGNRENPDIMALNEAVLADHGAAWDAPPASDPGWSTGRRAARDGILATYPHDKVWGFKDPRTLFTLAGWREALPDARLVGSLRHPMAVARSLEARNGMALDKGLTLWTAYNTRLLALARQEALPLLSFDTTRQAYLDAATRLARGLGLSPPTGGPDFFDPALRRQSGDGEAALPPETAALYAALQEHVVS